MPWGKFDDQYDISRKVADLSDAAFRLDVSAVLWCNRNLTDGVVPAKDIKNIRPQMRAVTKVADELVTAGRWHALPLAAGECMSCLRKNRAATKAPDGWLVHEYLTYSRSAKEVHKERADAAKRQQKARDIAKAKKLAATSGNVTVPSRRDDGVSHGPVTSTRPMPGPSAAAKAAAATREEPPPQSTPEELPIVGILRSRLNAAGLTASWVTVTDEQKLEVCDLVVRHGGDGPLIEAAKRMHRPDDPAVYATAWFKTWREIPTAGERLRAVGAAYCVEHTSTRMPCGLCSSTAAASA